jgi:hypothetical protein
MTGKSRFQLDIFSPRWLVNKDTEFQAARYRMADFNPLHSDVSCPANG